VAGDSSYSKVSLLLHCNGTNGSTTFTDNSVSPKTITVNGDAQLTTNSPKFGTASALFDGTGDYLAVTDSALDLGAGDFTVECFINTSSLAAYQGFFFNGTFGVSTNRIQLVLTTAGAIDFFAQDAGAGSFQLTSSASSIAINTWYHIAVTRSGSNGYLFINGSVAASATSTFTVNPAAGSTQHIGYSRFSGADTYFTGKIDECRITKGLARYTATFTAPVEEFPNGTVITTGSVPIAITPTAGRSIGRPITGDVPISVTPSSTTAYFDSHNRVLAGSVPISLVPTSTPPPVLLIWEWVI